MSVEAERKHISLHIEKNGGTSLTKYYMDSYGPGNVLIYNPVDDNLTRSYDSANIRTKAIFEQVKQLTVVKPLLPYISFLLINYRKMKVKSIPANSLPDDFLVIHGHFLADKFDEQIPDALKTVVIRHPLDRMLSHYAHWKRTKGVPLFRKNIPYSNEVTFGDFAFNDVFQNYQTQALAGNKLQRFDVVGVTEHLDKFCHQITNMTTNAGSTHKYPSVPHLYKNPESTTLRSLGIENTEKLTRDFGNYHNRDFANYELACQISNSY